MSTIESSSADDHAALPKPPSALYSHPNPPKLDGSLRTEKPALSTWTDRLKSYFLTNEGRIALASLIFTLTCVVLQHVMGTCDHAFGNADAIVKWHVFTPPCWLMIFLHGGYECSPLNFLVGAGPHTAVFFLVLSWVTLAYCIDRLWIHVTTGARVSKKRDLIVHGVIVALFLAAFGFNIWGYVLCESRSQVITLVRFDLGVCRGDSQACIPLVAGILVAFAAASAFVSEHVLELTKMIRDRRQSSEGPIQRITP